MRSKRAIAAAVKAITCAALCGPAPLLAVAQSDALVMVVNKSNTATAGMSKADCRRLLLGQTSAWPGGAKVIIVLRAEHSPERIAVLQKIAGMSEADFTRFMMQMMFSGHTPTSLHTETSGAAVKNYIKANPAAVGFLHEDEVGDGVKAVVKID